MTGFGTPRDVRGKHLKRLWELEFPEEAIDGNANSVLEPQAEQQQQQQQQQPGAAEQPRQGTNPPPAPPKPAQ